MLPSMRAPGRRICASEWRGGVVLLKILGVVMITAMAVGLIGVAMLGWTYEGPRRFFRRVANRQPDRADGRI